MNGDVINPTIYTLDLVLIGKLKPLYGIKEGGEE